MGQKSARSRDRSDLRSAAVSRKEQLRETGQIREAEPKKYYHWNDEPDNISLIINVSSVCSIVEHEIARGAAITYTFLRKKGLRTIYYGIKKGNVNMYVKTLKRFCKAFNIDLNWIEQNGVILGPYAYPIDMSSKGFVRLKTHVLNEGRILFLNKSVGGLGYVNQDPVLLRYFANAVREAGGTIRGEPRLGTYALVMHASPVLARALDASGLPFGRKTITNPSLDPLLKRDPELFRYHIRATLTEEGSCSLTIDKHRRVRFRIAWGRSVDITAKLSSKQIEILKRTTIECGKNKITKGYIKDFYVISEVNKNPPLSFDQEVILLNFYHKEKEWPEARFKALHVSKEDRITVHWDIRFTRPELVDLFHDEYGMLPGTWKARRFEKLYEAYKRYRGRKLIDEEIQEIRKIKEENPPKITAEWVSEKVQELFPGAKWGKDVERIRRKLRWKGER